MGEHAPTRLDGRELVGYRRPTGAYTFAHSDIDGFAEGATTIRAWNRASCHGRQRPHRGGLARPGRRRQLAHQLTGSPRPSTAASTNARGDRSVSIGSWGPISSTDRRGAKGCLSTASAAASSRCRTSGAWRPRCAGARLACSAASLAIKSQTPQSSRRIRASCGPMWDCWPQRR